MKPNSLKPKSLAKLRDFILALIAKEMNKPITDVASLFYAGEIHPRLEYPT